MNKTCDHCKTPFIDSSRSKNKLYCSKRCNIDAGHLRHKIKVEKGLIPKPKDNRNRKQERKKRYHEDIGFKLCTILRSRLSSAIKNNQKTGSAVDDLGCSINELKVYLESKWTEGMTWDNWCRDGWHIDHIIPLCSFNLENRDELLKACHYSNLQPLWRKDHVEKTTLDISKF